MTVLGDAGWDFWLSPSTGYLSMRIGDDLGGLPLNLVLAFLSVLRTECERTLANRLDEHDSVQ